MNCSEALQITWTQPVSQLLTTEPTPLDLALREIVVSDSHTYLARCLRDCVALSAACGARESKGADGYEGRPLHAGDTDGALHQAK